MRWDNLFDDLAGQLEQELSAEELDVRVEEERLRLGRLALRDRLLAVHAAHGRDAEYAVRMTLVDGRVMALRPITFGRDWFSAAVVDDSSRSHQCIIPIAAIAAVTIPRDQLADSLAGATDEQTSPNLSARLSLGFVLRDLCRRRSAVELHTSLGSVHGTVDRVGRDHLDLAVHEAGEPRRDSFVSQTRIVPLSSLVMVRL